MPHAIVVVFGDLGHSPRMQNHVRELVTTGYSVDFVGYKESSLPKEFVNDKVRIVPIPNIKFDIPYVPTILNRLLNIFLKLFCQTLIFLYFVLSKKLRKPDVVLVQSPPVLPTILVGAISARFYGAKFIVDWHNLGYTILAQSVQNPVIISIAKGIEILLSKLPDVNLVVSASQGDWMRVNCGVQAVALYDRPNPEKFKKLSHEEAVLFRSSLLKKLEITENIKKIFVSSTSWTPDEDFSILVEALLIMDQKLSDPILVLVTGKGPLKQFYIDKIKALNLRQIIFRTAWLSYEEYAKVLGCADMGVCLHSSSSGLDLPMKAVDMIGAGLPVAALEYAAIRELIFDSGDSKNGCLFKTGEELSEILLSSYQSNTENIKLESWQEHWKRTLFPLL